MGRNLTNKQKVALRKNIRKEIREETFSQQGFALRYKLGYHTVRRLISQDPKLNKLYKTYREKQRVEKNTNKKCSSKTKEYKGQEVEKDFKEKTGTVTTRSLDIKTVEELLKVAEVDTDIWEVDRSLINSWEVTVGGRNTGSGDCDDIDWSPDAAEKMTMEILDDLLILTASFGPFEKIVFPMGNDFLHSDNVYNTTTSFTSQPEADAWQNTFLRGELLGIAIIERMKKSAPVKIITVPGNHARHSEIALGRIFNAYYHNDKNVEIDAGSSPYKFHNFGVNLLGFEHGHSIRQQVRLAALMANETRLNGWKEARYCEFHCGDQHRKGSGKPHMFEEQGVSIEFLPGLTPPNEWHRLHSYNWQKRAGMAFIWDYTAGCVARFQRNIDNYTGKIMR